MTEQIETPTTSAADRRRGAAYAVAAAALAAVFLFIPILLLGFTAQVVANQLTGEIVAWRSSVDLTYVVLGPVALLSCLLLVIPLKLRQAAARFIGPSRATRWVGGLLAAAMAAVGVVWLLEGQERSSLAIQPEYWYAVAFGAAAVVILLASDLIARRAIKAAVAVLGAAAAGLAILVATLVTAWGSPPRIAADAQTVQVVSTPSGVELEPDTVRAGAVYFIVAGGGDPAGHTDFAFVGAGNAMPSGTLPAPLTDERIEALIRGNYEGTSIESGWGRYSKLTLLEGNYAFVIAGPRGEEPGVPPESVTVLEVVR
jgi:hypothetical protein